MKAKLMKSALWILPLMGVVASGTGVAMANDDLASIHESVARRYKAVSHISAEALEGMMGPDTLLFDVRSQSEFNVGRITIAGLNLCFIEALHFGCQPITQAGVCRHVDDDSIAGRAITAGQAAGDGRQSQEEKQPKCTANRFTVHSRPFRFCLVGKG